MGWKGCAARKTPPPFSPKICDHFALARLTLAFCFFDLFAFYQGLKTSNCNFTCTQRNLRFCVFKGHKICDLSLLRLETCDLFAFIFSAAHFQQLQDTVAHHIISYGNRIHDKGKACLKGNIRRICRLAKHLFCDISVT